MTNLICERDQHFGQKRGRREEKMASREKGGRQRDTPIIPAKMQFDEEPVNVNKWSTSAVKNALDDQAKKILKEELGCVEDFSNVDYRLFLCALACSLSLLALVYDYVFPFPASSAVLMCCAVGYFVLMVIVTVFSMFVEGNAFAIGLEKDEAGVRADNRWQLGSTLPRFSDQYTLSVSYTDGESKRKRDGSLTKSVACWFDDRGMLQAENFFRDIYTFLIEVSKEKHD